MDISVIHEEKFHCISIRKGRENFFFSSSSRVECTCTFYANLCHVLILLCGLGNFEKTFPFVPVKNSRILRFHKLYKDIEIWLLHPVSFIDSIPFDELAWTIFQSYHNSTINPINLIEIKFHHRVSLVSFPLSLPYLLHGYSYFHTRRINRSVKRQSEWSNLKRSSLRGWWKLGGASTSEPKHHNRMQFRNGRNRQYRVLRSVNHPPRRGNEGWPGLENGG